MQFSKPQIAWAIVCGALFALILVLWVRSYYAGINLSEKVSRSRAFTLITHRGFVGILVFEPNHDVPSPTYVWGLHSIDLEKFTTKPSWDFGIRTKSDRYVQMMVPWWFVLLAGVAAAGAAMKLKWRFSLRSLIVAITLVGIMLGIAVSVLF